MRRAAAGFAAVPAVAVPAVAVLAVAVRAVAVLVVAVLAVAVLAGCGAPDTARGLGIAPRDGRSGLHLSGTVGGRQVAVNDGAPRLRLGDCDLNTGPDTDLCFSSRDLNGEFFALVVENPDALTAGEALPVADPGCGQRCDEVQDVAVVDLQQGVTGRRLRAVGGRLQLTVVQPGRRYAGTLRLELAGGRLNGTFDVVPRPDE